MTETIEVVTDGDERVDQQALAEQLLAEAKASNVELIGPGCELPNCLASSDLAIWHHGSGE